MTWMEYQLKIDAQAEKFIQNKQRLTYFLITAGVAVIAFLVKLAVDNLKVNNWLVYLLIISCFCGLVTSGFSILNLRLENRSHGLHIIYRYAGKGYASLTDCEQKKWDNVNKWAARCLNGAFIFLFVEILFAVIFFVFLVMAGIPANPTK
ncbi:MAG: hypothetical protein ACLQUW_02465 [Desulfobaccales bacterium]